MKYLPILTTAKTLGASSSKIFKSIHLPILKPTIITGMLLVVAEVVKELPATLILRPFNFETLAVTHIFLPPKRECLKQRHLQ